MSTRSWVGIALLCLAACRSMGPRAAAHADERPWRYQVSVEDDGAELALALTLAAGDEVSLTVDPRTAPWIHAVAADGLGELERRGAAWIAPASESQRRVHWRFAAREAAQRIDDAEVIAERGRGLVGSLSSFLLHDAELGDAPFEISSAGAFVAARSRHLHVMSELDNVVPCAFGIFDVREVVIASTVITVVALAPLGDSAWNNTLEWVRRSESAIERQFGSFPLEELLVVIAPRRRRGVGSGVTRGNGGASIVIDAGTDTPLRAFEHDWVLTHEMIHAASPSMPFAQHWFEEGSATYLEPILRARAGRASADAVWFTMLDDYSQGLPERDDRGLDRTPTWGRLYYGGAIFCLEADIEIRSRTRNAKSLIDVFRAFAAEGANVTQNWDFERALEVGDRATGTTVLTELYQRFRESPEPRELDSLWKRLGVALDGRRVVYDDSAPLADVRRELVLGQR